MKPERVVLGVCGGIAAYRALDVARGLKHAGVQVQAVMTDNAQRFVSALSFRAITEAPVHTHMFVEPVAWSVTHVGLAEWADLVLICPATANAIGKVASGIADDLLSAVVVASRSPVAFAPAMNDAMWSNPIVESNVKRLKSLGYDFLEPASGHLACGREGKGRLPEPEVIVEYALGLLRGQGALSGKRLLVTAGPTREHIDAVRFVSNRSSGKMGYALAEAARRRGADVVLVTGPTNLEPPRGVKVVRVESASEMRDAVMEEFAEADVVIKAAAVSDYAPTRTLPGKMKKTDANLEIALARTVDILAEMGKVKGSRILVGFAAETDDLLENARSKLERKNLDLIVANPIGGADSAFGSDTARATILWRNGEREDLGVNSKQHLAWLIVDRIEDLLKARN